MSASIYDLCLQDPQPFPCDICEIVNQGRIIAMAFVRPGYQFDEITIQDPAEWYQRYLDGNLILTGAYRGESAAATPTTQPGYGFQQEQIVGYTKEATGEFNFTVLKYDWAKSLNFSKWWVYLITPKVIFRPETIPTTFASYMIPADLGDTIKIPVTMNWSGVTGDLAYVNAFGEDFFDCTTFDAQAIASGE